MLPDETSVNTLLAEAGVHEAEVETTALGVVCRVVPDVAVKVLQVLRESDLDFRVLVDMLGTDTGESIEITYHLRSLTRDEDIFVKTTLGYDGVLASVWNVFPSALMPERETAELLGLKLSGHPNPKRLLTTDGIEPLLRKSIAVRSAEEVRNR